MTEEPRVTEVWTTEEISNYLLDYIEQRFPWIKHGRQWSGNGFLAKAHGELRAEMDRMGMTDCSLELRIDGYELVIDVTDRPAVKMRREYAPDLFFKRHKSHR
jgi:hypothetical protein